MSLQVILVRPGSTLYDEELRVQGILDLPLCERGIEEASLMARELISLGLSAIYSGPSQNATQTANLIAESSGLKPRMLEELRNLNQGLWQALQFEEIRRRNSKVFRQWLEDPRTVCPPQGETIEEAIERIRPVFRSLLKRHKAQVIALVVAEPMAKVMAAYLQGLNQFHFDDMVRTGYYESIVPVPSPERRSFLLA
jgi:broad specificity phosphatase PhoE